MRGKEIKVAGIPVRALRVSYVGELGWELHCKTGDLQTLHNELMSVGDLHNMRHFGTYAMNSLRMEKGYKAWGSELTTEVSPVEAGMIRFVRGGDDYLGSQVVTRKKKDGVALHLVYCEVAANDADPIGNAPVYFDDTIVGITTSASYGHYVQKSLLFAYVNSGFESPGTILKVEILGERKTAKVLSECAWDEGNERLKV